MKLLFTPLFLLLFLSAQSQWSNTSNEFYDSLHMPVSIPLREQTNALVVRSYPDSGYIIIWLDYRTTGNGADIYAQKLDKSGNTVWATDGVPVITGPLDQTYRWAQNTDYRNYGKACTDSANGFYIAAHDYNANGNGNRVVVQHIRENGTMVFPNTGYIVAEGTPSTFQYAYPTLIADGRKGFFIAYMRQLFGGADVMAYCMRDDNGVMKNLGGGQMDMNGVNQQENSPCGLRNVISNSDAYATDFYIYPDLQGGCNIVMNLQQNFGGNERTFIGYNRLCRVKKDCITSTLHRTSSLTSYETVIKSYQKDDIVQLYNYTTFFNTVVCGDLNGNLYTVTSFYVENLGNGFMPVNNPVYNTSNVRGAVLPTGGNINAEVITASERNLVNSSVTQYFVHAYYRFNEIYDSLPYELCSKMDNGPIAIRPSPPAGTVLDKINFGHDTLTASSFNDYDYTFKATGNRFLATQMIYPSLTEPRKIVLQQLKVQRMSADSFAIVLATNNKKGVVIGEEVSTGAGATSISYDFPHIITDDAGNALFFIRDYYRNVRVSPIGEGGTLSWGSMGKPIGAGVYRNNFMQPDYPIAVMTPDGTGFIAWHDNRWLNTDGSNNIWGRHLDNLNTVPYTPPVKKTALLPLFGNLAYPEFMTGFSHQFTAFNIYNSVTGVVSPVVEISDDYNLGAVEVSTYQHNGPSRLFSGKPYLQRNYKIKVQNNPAGAANLHVRLYFTQADFDAMRAVDPTILNPGHLQVVKQEDNTAGYAPSTYSPVAGETVLSPVSWQAVDGGYYIEIVVNSFSNFFVFKSAGTLPLTWVNVQAQWASDNQAKISWQVAQQQNVKEYVVQASTDGVHYTNSCTVPAGNTDYYNCVVTATGGNKFYYRVLQVDLDSRSSTSKAVTLEKLGGRNSLVISPNPSYSGNISLNYNSDDKITRLVLVGSNGAVIWQSRVSLSGSGSFILPVQNLAKGVYGLQIERFTRKETLKLIKQ
jgi:hypothetical protein